MWEMVITVRPAHRRWRASAIKRSDSESTQYHRSPRKRGLLEQGTRTDQEASQEPT